LQAHEQQRQRSTSLGHSSENGSTDSKTADVQVLDGATSASPEMPTEHNGDYENDIDAVTPNLAVSQQLHDAVHSWLFTDQGHQAMGKFARVHVFNNDNSITSRGESESMRQSAYSVNDKDDLDSNNHDNDIDDGDTTR
jgi:hypothetical protein